VNGRSECYDVDRAEFDRIVARLRDVDQRSRTVARQRRDKGSTAAARILHVQRVGVPGNINALTNQIGQLSLDAVGEDRESRRREMPAGSAS
jgi:hypothetical protein